MHLLNAGVDQWFGVSALNNKLLLATESGSGQQHELSECQDAVTFNNLGETLGLLDLLGDGLWRIEKVNFAVCLTCLTC